MIFEPSCIEIKCTGPAYQIIPWEYQGYIFLAFLIISVPLITYAFYYIVTHPLNNSVQKSEPEHIPRKPKGGKGA